MSNDKQYTNRKYEFKFSMVGGYDYHEARQKLTSSIDKGDEVEACWWAFCLYISGYYQSVWRQLGFFASQKIGNADPWAVILVRNLHENYKLFVTKKVRYTEKALSILMQAVIYLCRAEKNCESENMCMFIEEQFAHLVMVNETAENKLKTIKRVWEKTASVQE